MNNYNIYPYRNDLVFSDEKNYRTIYFNNLNNKNNIKNKLKNEIVYFFNKMNICKNNHIFVVGLGNINHTADSVGPKVLKYINVNSYLENIGIKINGNKVSALEPGVLGETGILTEKIMYSFSE